MRTVILVPRKEDHGERDQIWKYVRNWYESHHPYYEIFEGHDPAAEISGNPNVPFSIAAARNDAARQAGDDWDVAVVIDADTIVEPAALGDAVVRAALGTRLWVAGDVYMNMDAKSSKRILHGGLWFPRPEGNLPKNGVTDSIFGEPASGVVVFSRALWEATGGYLATIQGWGYEDLIFMTCCHIFGDGSGWIEDSILLHFYHEKSRKTDDTQRNYQVWQNLHAVACSANAQTIARKYLTELGHTWLSA